ncbi:MAG: hypothetical protein IJS17_05300, partial [Clostridia bacterium]|nr:hypothetical protein [Clostridia bacterium]
MIAVHFASFLCYIPLMSIIILYKASIAAEKSEKRYLLIVFAVSVAVALGAFAFFHYNEAYNLKMTYEELDEYLSMKGSENNEYYSYAFFKKFKMESPEGVMHFNYKELISADFLPASLKKFVNEIAGQIYMNFSLLNSIPSLKNDAAKMIFILMLSGAPAMVCIYRTFGKTFGSSKDKLKRFSCFCAMALFPFTFLSSVLFSYDYARWYSHAFTGCFIFFLVVLKSQGDELLPFRGKTTVKPEKLACLLYMVLSFLIRFDPYRVLGS